MTDIATPPLRLVIDVRCSAALRQPSTAEGRCQLFAGHDGPHAVLFTRDGERTLQTWEGAGREPHAQPCRQAVMSRPWMRGYPVPAWTEPTADPLD